MISFISMHLLFRYYLTLLKHIAIKTVLFIDEKT